ncbi:MAG: polymerase primary sigma factor [Solirubrobacteraceae bacterium]|jgi:RNA polymerase primary sigma factor|nr:polymerase primary sigma factor [Solirubrobacteraceae bacterium]
MHDSLIDPRVALDRPDAVEEPEVVDMTPDSLEHLLAASRRYPLLTPHQEIELAKRIERGDLAAKERMINSNLRLVVSQARRYLGSGLSMTDLVQEGMFGLIRASEKFDWRRGYRFSTYATLWIRQAMQRGAGNSGRTVRLPVHVGQRVRNLRRAERELAAELGRDPTDEELVAKTKFTLEQIEDLRDIDRDTVSLDTPVGEDGDTSLGALIPVEEDSLEDQAEEGERRRTVASALHALPEPERNVIALRYGMTEEPPQTPAQTSRRLGVSRDQVERLERRALDALRQRDELAALREAA